MDGQRNRAEEIMCMQLCKRAVLIIMCVVGVERG